jgi:hypothetical protein
VFNFILQLTIKIILKKELKKVSQDKKIRKSILGCSQNVVKHLEIKCSQTQKSGLRKSRKPHIYYSLVRLAGVEPARPKALPPEDSVSAIPPQPHLEYFVIVL